MTGQAGQPQPGGQARGQSPRGVFGRIDWLWQPWLVLAWLALVIPFNRGGIWDPHELRVAEFGRHLAHQMFGVDAARWGGEQLGFVTAKQLGQGELAITSPALGFAVFGVSDWAGRATSVFWGTVALLALWLVMGRLVGRMARAASALVLVSTPLFAWQSRTMLGDAATIGTLALSSAGLLLVCCDRKDTGLLRRACYWSMAIAGLGAGTLCRGLLIGVAAPSLSVGLASLLCHSRAGEARHREWRGYLLIAVGIVATAIGVREALLATRGFSLLLGATLDDVTHAVPFDHALSNLLHQTFPLSAFLPVSVVALAPLGRAPDASDNERTVAFAFAYAAIFCLGVATLVATRGVELPFPAIPALAGLTGIAICRLHTRGGSSTVPAVAVLTMAVLVFADFTNLPEKVMLTTGVYGERLPESFKAQGQPWLRAELAVLATGCALMFMSNIAKKSRDASIRTRYRVPMQWIRQAFGGQLLSGFVLVETSLVTVALLQRAHEEGWITVPAFDAAHALLGSSLFWVWAVPPLVLFVLPLGCVTVQLGVDSLVKRGFGANWRTGTPLARARLSPGLIGGSALITAGLTMSLGYAPLLAEQLSAKRAALQYRARADAGEPLALLGMKPESMRYYLGTLPQAYADIGEAAKWLQAAGTRRRWLALGADHLAEVNAAFRAESNGKNLAIVDSPTGNTLLATDRLRSAETNHNPLDDDILNQPPDTARSCDYEFGGAIRLVGWDVRSETGTNVTRLRTGVPYELRFAFRVQATTNVDWQVFVHLDGGKKRHNGDHEPVVGQYPTTLWQPGDVVLDRHRMVLDRGSLAGSHTLFMGLFRGGRRLEVTRGLHSDNRVTLGTLEVE